MPKYVFSNTLEQADWTNLTIPSGDFATEIAKLKEHAEKKPLCLVESKTVGDGIALLTYEPA